MIKKGLLNLKMKELFLKKELLKIELFPTKIKLIIFIIIIFFYEININFFFKYINFKDKHFLIEKKYYLYKYLILKDRPIYINDSLIDEEKINFLEYLSNETGQKLKKVDIIFYTVKRRFGNALSNLNKLIFYCEIIGCKKIILDKNIYWFLKRKIKINNRIIISVDNQTKFINNNSSILYLNTNKIYNYFFKIRPEIRINLLKYEIIKNLISKDKNNPLIQKLINYYSNIKYLNNNLIKDISYLVNAFNIVASISSFLTSIIQLNFNLNYLWDYNIYKVVEKLRHFHYDLYKIPDKNFIIYRMEPSINYKKIMYKWRYKRKQKKLMLKEKCKNGFAIIKYK